MKKDPFEPLHCVERLLTQQFGNAVRELHTIMDLVNV